MALHPDVLKANPTGLLEKRENLENIPGADKNKNQPGIKVQAGIGDWVRNSEGVVGQIISINENGKPTIKIPRTGAEVNNEGWKIIVKANEVNKDDSVDVLQKELRILNSPEALMKFATPTPEGQAARKNKIALCCTDDLTDFGHKLVYDRFIDAIYGKATAKILGVDKLGQRDLISVKLGDNEEFPFTILLEVMHDGEGKVAWVRLMHDILPAEVLKDFAKFLNRLANKGKADASLDELITCRIWEEVPEEERKLAMAVEFDVEEQLKLAEAGPKLERCVRDVTQRFIQQFRKKNKKEPSAAQKKKFRSRGFAICTAQGLK